MGMAFGATGAAYLGQSHFVAAKEAGEGAFSPKEFRGFPLMESEKLSSDSALFRFALPKETPEMGMPVASCIVCRYKDEDGKYVIRPYTPTTLDDTKGHFDLVIKKYEGAKMGTHIFNLKPGDNLEVKGPIVKQRYTPNKYKHIGMVAGGSGITPMYQIIQEVLKNKDDNTKVTLVYGNRSEGDILLKKELDNLARKHDNFDVFYTVDTAGWLWGGNTGHVDAKMLSKYLPSAKTPKSFVFVCGPGGMMKAVSGTKAPDYTQGEVGGALAELGYGKDQVFKF